MTAETAEEFDETLEHDGLHGADDRDDDEAIRERERLNPVAKSTTVLPLGHHRVKMALLTPAARNPRRGAVADVVDSLMEFGQHRDVVVQQATNQVIVGNHLFKGAQTLGWDEVDVFVVDDDDDKALRRAIADNAVGDLATWEKEELADVMKEIGPVPGFDQDAVDKLLDEVVKKDKEATGGEDVVFPIVNRFLETYDYVVVVATNETDSAWLQTIFDARREASYQDTNIGRSHVISVERARELIGNG